MSSTMKATILACVVTVFLSIGGAWGVLQTDTATQGSDIDTATKRIEKILHIISEQQKQINKNNVEINKNRKDIGYIKDTLCQLNDNLKGLNKSLDTISEVAFRMDERMKNLEEIE